MSDQVETSADKNRLSDTQTAQPSVFNKTRNQKEEQGFLIAYLQ